MLRQYIEKTLGQNPRLGGLNAKQMALMPLALAGRYKLESGQINGIALVFASLRHPDNFTPALLERHGELIGRALEMPVVFVIPEIESWERLRLIERRVAFVQPGKQLYLPHLYIDLSDLRKKIKIENAGPGPLSGPAMLAVLFQLQIGSLEGINNLEIAKYLDYSSMTITVLERELEEAQLVKISGERDKEMTFLLRGKTLWEKFLERAVSPVRETWFVSSPDGPPSGCKAGIGALSEYSDLSAGAETCIALSRKNFIEWKTIKKPETLHKTRGEFQIQVWNYDPRVLASKGIADRLSLFLSLRNDADPRVQEALRQMMEGMKW